MNKRKVDNSTLTRLIVTRSFFILSGIVLIIFSVLVIFPFINFLSSKVNESCVAYDYGKIEKMGIQKTGRIRETRTLNNATVNQKHPIEISYAYENNGQNVSDKFITIDLDKAAELNRGDVIQIKAYENQSMIIGMEPFSFPFYVFYLIPYFFIATGLVFIVIGLIPALRTFQLYKNGSVRDAYITSMYPYSGMGRKVQINYYYLSDNGMKFTGKSSTKDFTILMDKKVDDKIKIFVSEVNEKRSCIVPQAEAEKNDWVI